MICELSIIIPTFNEINNIRSLVDSLHKVLAEHKWEILFVDDDSSDGTAACVREIAQQDPQVRCIQRLKRRGLSSACIEGILACSSPYILVMDADMQHDENIIVDMLDKIRQQNNDLVIGSRYVEGGSTGILSDHRVWISQLATSASRLILKYPVRDPMSGFFMLKRSFFEQVMHKLSGKGFKILLDILVSTDGKAKFVEIPYTMRARTEGESKLGSQVIWEFVMLILNKMLGQTLPVRFLSFAMVGFSGVFVHLSVLAIIHRVFHMDFIVGQAIATLVAMTTNFILNNHFTFRESRLQGSNFFRGLFSFYLACAIGALINIFVAESLFEKLLPWWLAGAIGAVVGAVWNYAATATFTWGNAKNKKIRDGVESRNV